MNFIMLGLVIMLFGGMVGKIMMPDDGGGCFGAMAFIGIMIILLSIVGAFLGTVFDLFI